MSKVFDKLGRTVLPKVFDKLSGVGLSDLMDVKAKTTAVGAGGGRIKSAETTVYEDIPVVYAPKNNGYRNMNGDQSVSNQDYTLQFPTHSKTGILYEIDPRIHRLHIQSRAYPSDEPAMIFRILSIRDLQGNMFEADVVRENV